MKYEANRKGDEANKCKKCITFISDSVEAKNLIRKEAKM
jgi:hypothetical protein